MQNSDRRGYAGSSGGVVHRITVAALGIVVVGWCAGMPAAAADDSFCTAVGTYCAFYSPSHHINCEINTGGYVGPDSVYCQTVQPPQSVHMDNAGLFYTCTGENCIGNAAEGTPTLAYGQTMALGPFSCLSQVTGVTCTVAQGRGFRISTSGTISVG
jgi:hypothetical protein